MPQPRTKLATLGAVAALAACGGGAVLAVLGSLGVGAGDYLVDLSPATRVYETRTDCGGDVCSFSINPVTAGQDRFARDFAVSVTDSNFTDCPAGTAGRVTDGLVSIPGCFVGQALSVNELLSGDGVLRVFHNFDPDLARGVWVDIHDDSHRFKFDDDTTGCEFLAGVERKVDVTVEQSNYGQSGAPIPTTSITALMSQHRPAVMHTGTFVSAGSLTLAGGASAIELERRDLTANCQ